MNRVALFLLLCTVGCESPTGTDDVDVAQPETVRTDTLPAPTLPDSVRIRG